MVGNKSFHGRKLYAVLGGYECKNEVLKLICQYVVKYFFSFSPSDHFCLLDLSTFPKA